MQCKSYRRIRGKRRLVLLISNVTAHALHIYLCMCMRVYVQFLFMSKFGIHDFPTIFQRENNVSSMKFFPFIEYAIQFIH